MQRGLYRHYKGGLYVVIGVVIDSTNDTAGREMVLYTSCTTGRMHARARREFEELVDDGRGGRVARFWLEVPA